MADVLIQRTFRHAGGQLATNVTVDVVARDGNVVLDTETTNELGTVSFYIAPGQYDFKAFGARIPFDAIDAETAGAATAAITAHIAALDPHGDRAYTDAEIDTLKAYVDASDIDLTALAELAEESDDIADLTAAVQALAEAEPDVTQVEFDARTSYLSAVAANTGGVPGAHMVGQVPFAMAVPFNYYYPFVVEEQVTLTGYFTEVTTAGPAGARQSTAIYAADAALQPDGLVADFGEVAADSLGLKTVTLATPVVLPRGRYIIMQRASHACNFRALSFRQRQISHVGTALGSASVFRSSLYVGAAYTAVAPANPPNWTNVNIQTAPWICYGAFTWTAP
jgi:hypothetical protein